MPSRMIVLSSETFLAYDMLPLIGSHTFVHAAVAPITEVFEVHMAATAIMKQSCTALKPA